mgnify:CR=1 FL=1
MGLVAAACTKCGGKIEVDDTQEAGICSFCGTAFITEKAINNYNTYHTHNTTVSNTTNITGNAVVNVFNDELNKFFVIEGTTLVKYNGKIPDFKVPDGITHIASRIFDSDWKPTSIFIPKSVIHIDKQAFQFSFKTHLDSVTFEHGSQLKSIGHNAFHNVELEDINLPDGLENIADWAFSCVKSVIIPDSVKVLGKFNFDKAPIIFAKADTVPSNWSIDRNKIVAGVIEKDKKFGNFIYADTTSGIVIYDYTGNVYTTFPSEIEGKKVVGVLDNAQNKVPPSKADSFTFTKEIESIPDNWGDKFPDITSITFEEPSNITVIGKSAFAKCSKLKSSIRLPSSIRRVEQEAFYNCNADRIYLQGDIQYIGKHAFARSGYSTSFPSSKIIITQGTKIALCDSDAFINGMAYLDYSVSQGRSNERIARMGNLASGTDKYTAKPVQFVGPYIFVPDDYDISIFNKNVTTFLKYRDQHHLDSLLRLSSEKLEAMTTAKKGCYIATAVYGSYNCPQVFVLRRYRDKVLSSNFVGRLFIKMYYIFSPLIVKLFGKAGWFNRFWKRRLDKKVKSLKQKGFEDKPYTD